METSLRANLSLPSPRGDPWMEQVPTQIISNQDSSGAVHLGVVPLPLREQMKWEADKGDPAWATSWVGSFPVVILPFSALCPHAVNTFRASVYTKANSSALLLNHHPPTPYFSCKWSGCLLQPPPILTPTPQEDPAHTRPDG